MILFSMLDIVILIIIYIILYKKYKKEIIAEIKFLKRIIPTNCYITNKNKNCIQKEYNNIKRNLKFKALITNNKELKYLLNKLDNLNEYILELNQKYIEEELKENKSYFDTLFKYPLDLDQRRAIVTDDNTNIIIAGAGSGKSSTILGKIKYLTEKKNAKGNEILAISFTNAAVDNLKSKLQNEDINCYTFHSLGSKILKEKYKNNYSIDDNSMFRLRNIIIDYFKNEIIQNENKLEKFIKFFSIYLHFIETDFNSMGEKWNYENGFNLKTLQGKFKEITHINTLNNITINGEIVKSHEELIIANFLFLNGIKYEYEYTYREDMSQEEYNSYKPDFYLSDYNIYIEHFGINEEGRSPQYTEIEEKKYIEGIKWKRELHYKNNTKLIETYSYEYKNGNLLESLTKKLKKYNVMFSKVNYVDIYKVIMNDKYNYELEGFIQLIAQFIEVFKGNGFSDCKFDEFITNSQNIENNYQRNRELIFLEFTKEIFEIYEKSLHDDKKIDFNDMINIAVNILESENIKIPLSYIFVDEYQDTSYMKYKLLDTLIKKSEAKLVIVGDDWQSIYRFAGSNLDLFVNYNKYFNNPEICKINTTHRNSQELIDVMGKFIMKNKIGQIEKNLISDKFESKPINIYYYNTEIEKALKIAVNDLVKNNCKKILILGRNKNELEKNIINSESKIKEWENKLQIEIEFKTVHSSKGLEADGVIVMGLNNALNGFPNKMQNDQVIRYVIPTVDNIKYEEERRLFYVALTRTKSKCCLIVPNYKPSEFISELYSIDSNKINAVYVEEDNIKNNPYCPHCKNGKLIIKQNNKTNNKFVACTNYPKCKYKSKYTDIIERTIICPRCGGFLVKKKGKFGNFYGCTNYPYCGQTAKIEEYDNK